MILLASTWQGALTASVPLGPPALVTAPTKEDWSEMGRCGLWKKTGVLSVPARWGWFGAAEIVTISSLPPPFFSLSISFCSLLTHRSLVVPEKMSVLICTTTNDDAEWQAHLLGMKSEVWGGKGTAEHRGSRAEKSMLVPPLRAGSAFKIGWVRALMSPHSTLLQLALSLKWSPTWTCSLFWWRHPEKQSSEVCLQWSETVDFHSGHVLMTVLGHLVSGVFLVILSAGLFLILSCLKVCLMLTKIKFCHWLVLLYALQNGPIKLFDFIVLYFFFCWSYLFIFLWYCFPAALTKYFYVCWDGTV